MGYNSKNIKASNLSEDACQKSCESKQNCGSYGQRERPTLRDLYFCSPIQIVLSKHTVLIMRVINLIINMDDIRQEKSNKSPILKLNERLK